MNKPDLAAIERHYSHAREKHPYFYDALLPCDLPKDAAWFLPRETCEKQNDDNLEKANRRLQLLASKGSVTFMNVLDAEVREILDALMNGDAAQAREECYDAIAVLLRVIDVLDGSQPLGNPAAKTKKGGAE